MAIIEVTRSELAFLKKGKYVNKALLAAADAAAKERFKTVPYYLQEARKHEASRS